MELMNRTQEEIVPQSVKDALCNLKSTVGALKVSPNETADEFAGHLNPAKVNSGKIANANEILRKVLSEENLDTVIIPVL
ncbi:MAG: hypothetical protein J1E64_08165 [Acetatifactor sp.]|nr:hypothetical protein [Acetatifactor sp.]